MAVCVVVIAFSGWKLWGIWNESRQVSSENSELEQMVVTNDTETEYLEPDWAALEAANPNLVGWLYVPGVDFSYPIVQGSDNSYYLNHTASGAVNRIGAIFLDAGAAKDFTTDNSLIYGHSVDTGGMFTDMDKYEDQAFFDAHPYFYVLTPSGNYRCQVYTFAKTVEGTAYYQTDFGDYGTDIVNEMKTTALYATDVDPTGKKLITLSTCDLDYGYDSINRLVLTGVAEPYSGRIRIED